MTASDPDMVDGTFDAVMPRRYARFDVAQAALTGRYWNSLQADPVRAIHGLLIRTIDLRTSGRVGRGVRVISGRCGLWTSLCVAWIHRLCTNQAASRSASSAAPRWATGIARTVRNIARNQVLLVARHYDPRMLAPIRLVDCSRSALWGLVAVRHGAAIAWIAGKLEGVRLFARIGGGDHPHISPSPRRQASGRSARYNRQLATICTGGCTLRLTSRPWSELRMPGIVVVTYNSADVIDGCLDACLRRALGVDRRRRQCIFGRHSRCTSGAGRAVRLIANKTNRGFAGRQPGIRCPRRSAGDPDSEPRCAPVSGIDDLERAVLSRGCRSGDWPAPRIRTGRNSTVSMSESLTSSAWTLAFEVLGSESAMAG